MFFMLLGEYPGRACSSSDNAEFEDLLHMQISLGYLIQCWNPMSVNHRVTYLSKYRVTWSSIPHEEKDER